MLYTNPVNQAYATSEQQPIRADIMPIYGDRLKERRLALGMTQDEVARAVGIKSVQQYNDWERGKYSPSIKHLVNLAPVLRCSIDYLVGLVDDPGATLEEKDLSEDERELIRRRREDPYFREITNVLLGGVRPGRIQELSRPLIESGKKSSIPGSDESS